MTPKQRAAFGIRDAAIQTLGAKGCFMNIQGVPHLQYKDEVLSILIRTPFQKYLFAIPERTRQMAALRDVKIKPNLPYGLDIWLTGGGKVFNLEWDKNGDFHIANFKRGEWEQHLFN